MAVIAFYRIHFLFSSMSASGIYLKKDELEAMSSIPHLQRCFYVVLRNYMDYANGKVGIKRGISWQALREELYVDPRQGIKGGSPTKDQVRTAAGGLARVGLISNVSVGKRLIFECLLAQTDKNALKKSPLSPHVK